MLKSEPLETLLALTLSEPLVSYELSTHLASRDEVYLLDIEVRKIFGRACDETLIWALIQNLDRWNDT